MVFSVLVIVVCLVQRDPLYWSRQVDHDSEGVVEWWFVDLFAGIYE